MQQPQQTSTKRAALHGAREREAYMASKANARQFDILLPRLNRAASGEVFAAGNYVRRTGTIAATLTAARLQGGSIGVHASNDGSVSLCALPLESPTKDAAARTFDSCKAAGKNGAALTRVAQSVTCKFCAARLVAAGVLTADTLNASMPAEWRAYALDYGSRNAADELAAIETRAREAAAAVEAAKAARAAKRQSRKAAS